MGRTDTPQDGKIKVSARVLNMDKNGTIIRRLNSLEGEISALKNFLNLLVVADRALGGQITRATKENILHSKAQKRTLEKAVEAGVNYEERLCRIERQVSQLFDSVHRQSAILKTKKDRHRLGLR